MSHYAKAQRRAKAKRKPWHRRLSRQVVFWRWFELWLADLHGLQPMRPDHW